MFIRSVHCIERYVFVIFLGVDKTDETNVSIKMNYAEQHPFNIGIPARPASLTNDLLVGFFNLEII